jgi:hypothetical protein
MTTRREAVARAVTMAAIGINRREQERIVLAMMRHAFIAGTSRALGAVLDGRREFDVGAAFDRWVDET